MIIFNDNVQTDIGLTSDFVNRLILAFVDNIDRPRPSNETRRHLSSFFATDHKAYLIHI